MPPRCVHLVIPSDYFLELDDLLLEESSSVLAGVDAPVMLLWIPSDPLWVSVTLFCVPQEGCVWLLNGSAMVLREYCNFVNNYVKLIIFCFCSDPGLCTCCFVLWPTPGFVSAETSADDLCYCLWLWSVLLWVLVILCLRLEGSTPIPVLSRFFWGSFEFEDMDSCGLWWMGVRHCYYFGYIQGMY